MEETMNERKEEMQELFDKLAQFFIKKQLGKLAIWEWISFSNEEFRAQVITQLKTELENFEYKEHLGIFFQRIISLPFVVKG